ncbi:hypothetical protein BD779DRAFT_1567905 [Infundibulicybe gibba]|nr:hypothetical protein BD779DRAFT_1567905 [Infundibulicybe gibba]
MSWRWVFWVMISFAGAVLFSSPLPSRRPTALAFNSSSSAIGPRANAPPSLGLNIGFDNAGSVEEFYVEF